MKIKPQLRIALIYVVASMAWVWASDRLLDLLVQDPHTHQLWGAWKRWAFVVCSAYLIYWLVHRDMQRLDGLNNRLLQGHAQTLSVLVSAMDIRHKETSDHSERVMRMAEGLGRLAGVRGQALQNLRLGALLHDIGKLALPDCVLIKPGPLTSEEINVMRTHTRMGHDMLRQIDFLRDATDIPFSHHERWDGGGYPQGLVGEMIPLAARIFSVVDVWDALSHPRVYKPAWPREDVIDYLKNAAGSQLDPCLVRLFLRHYDELVALGANEASV
ncbi:HD-GYP domain-containing protein [Dyella sp.]|uniref:HD-GYP domain-containing protein n=1 Tax=Dyella sp. TaxID=1869338 RepID=UPI002ED2F82B